MKSCVHIALESFLAAFNNFCSWSNKLSKETALADPKAAIITVNEDGSVNRRSTRAGSSKNLYLVSIFRDVNGNYAYQTAIASKALTRHDVSRSNFR